jgi:hypothetical protein
MAASGISTLLRANKTKTAADVNGTLNYRPATALMGRMVMEKIKLS